MLFLCCLHYIHVSACHNVKNSHADKLASDFLHFATDIIILHPLINNRFIISESSLSVNLHAFRYLQTTLGKSFPKLEGHDRRESAYAASLPASGSFMVKCRGKLFRFFQFSVINISHRGIRKCPFVFTLRNFIGGKKYPILSLRIRKICGDA